MLAAGLYSLRHDPRYGGDNPALFDLAQRLDEQVEPGDAALLERGDYQLAFMNALKTPALFLTLPYAPGERHNPGMVYDAPPDDFEALLGRGVPYTLDWVASRHRRVWLVMGYGPFHSFALRPAERYLVEHYFPVASFETSATTRAILFEGTRAPAPDSDPATPLDIAFGEQLALDGFDLPAGTTFRPGQVAPVSLVWRPLATMDVDYNVSAQIADASGFPVGQHDSPPQGTFGYTSQWVVGQRYRDNHGIQLPDNLPPGEYGVQIIVYRWQDGQRLGVSQGGQVVGDVARIGTITVR
jgi:hypothetical protein